MRTHPAKSGGRCIYAQVSVPEHAIGCVLVNRAAWILSQNVWFQLRWRMLFKQFSERGAVEGSFSSMYYRWWQTS